MSTLTYKGMNSSRLKTIWKAVHYATLALALAVIGYVADTKIDKEVVLFFAGVWAGTINVGIIGYVLSETANRFAAAKASQYPPEEPGL